MNSPGVAFSGLCIRVNEDRLLQAPHRSLIPRDLTISMEILFLAGTYYLVANGILRFTHFLNVVKQAESEGLVSSRNYALLMLVNIVTLNTCQNMGLHCLFSNTTVSPIAGLAGRVPLLTSELTEI